MEVISVLIDPILPVFAIMALGFVMGRTEITTVDDARVVNRFAMSVLLPIMVFDLIANAPVHLFSITPLLIYGGGQLLVFVAGYFLATRIFGIDREQSVLLAFCGVFANNVLYVLPISEILYGKDQILPITSIITWDASFAFGGAIIFLQLIILGKVAPSKVAKTLGTNPILIALVAGLAFAFADLPIPTPVQTFLDFNSAAAAPVALFAMGVVLSQTRFKIEREVLSFTLIKLLIFPFIIWLGLEFLTPAEPGREQYLLGAAGPSGAMAFTLAFLHGIRTDAIAQVIVITSVLTLISLALLA
ncbi:MAG: AEC family transporter [Pseudomonadota bacterium]